MNTQCDVFKMFNKAFISKVNLRNFGMIHSDAKPVCSKQNKDRIPAKRMMQVDKRHNIKALVFIYISLTCMKIK